jgi:hypothetical protein
MSQNIPFVIVGDWLVTMGQNFRSVSKGKSGDFISAPVTFVPAPGRRRAPPRSHSHDARVIYLFTYVEALHETA